MTDDELLAAANRYWDLTSNLTEARASLIAEIRAARDRGVRQVDIVKATGWTREQIRRVCRAE